MRWTQIKPQLLSKSFPPLPPSCPPLEISKERKDTGGYWQSPILWGEGAVLGWDGGCNVNFDSMKMGLESMSAWIPTLSFTVRELGAACKEAKLDLVLGTSLG